MQKKKENTYQNGHVIKKGNLTNHFDYIKKENGNPNGVIPDGFKAGVLYKIPKAKISQKLKVGCKYKFLYNFIERIRVEMYIETYYNGIDARKACFVRLTIQVGSSRFSFDTKNELRQLKSITKNYRTITEDYHFSNVYRFICEDKFGSKECIPAFTNVVIALLNESHPVERKDSVPLEFLIDCDDVMMQNCQDHAIQNQPDNIPDNIPDMFSVTTEQMNQFSNTQYDNVEGLDDISNFMEINDHTNENISVQQPMIPNFGTTSPSYKSEYTATKSTTCNPGKGEDYVCSVSVCTEDTNDTLCKINQHEWPDSVVPYEVAEYEQRPIRSGDLLAVCFDNKVQLFHQSRNIRTQRLVVAANDMNQGFKFDNALLNCICKGWAAVNIHNFSYSKSDYDRVACVTICNQIPGKCRFVTYDDYGEIAFSWLIHSESWNIRFRKKMNLQDNQVLILVDRGHDLQLTLQKDRLRTNLGQFLTRKRFRGDRGYQMPKVYPYEPIGKATVCLVDVESSSVMVFKQNRRKHTTKVAVSSTYPDTDSAYVHHEKEDQVPIAYLGLAPVNICAHELKRVRKSKTRGIYVVPSQKHNGKGTIVHSRPPIEDLVGIIDWKKTDNHPEIYLEAPNEQVLVSTQFNPCVANAEKKCTSIVRNFFTTLFICLTIVLLGLSVIPSTPFHTGSIFQRFAKMWHSQFYDNQIPSYLPTLQQTHHRMTEGLRVRTLDLGTNDVSPLKLDLSTNAIRLDMAQVYPNVTKMDFREVSNNTNTNSYQPGFNHILENKLWQLLSDTNTSKILLEGKPGTGKSTVLDCISQSWTKAKSLEKLNTLTSNGSYPITATSTALQAFRNIISSIDSTTPLEISIQANATKLLADFDLVVWVPLNKLSKLNSFTPWNILDKSNLLVEVSTKNKHSINFDISTESIKVLWLFDSVDEAIQSAEGTTTEFQMFLNYLIGKSSVRSDATFRWIRHYIVTARPGHFPSKTDLAIARKPNLMKIVVKGFASESDRHTYLNMYFQGQDTELVAHIEHFLEHGGPSKYLSLNPLYVQMISMAYNHQDWNDANMGGKYIRTKVFSTVINRLLNRQVIHLQSTLSHNMRSVMLKKFLVSSWYIGATKLAASSQRNFPEEMLERMLNEAANELVQEYSVSNLNYLSLLGYFKKNWIMSFDYYGELRGNEYFFSHETFREYFLGLALFHHTRSLLGQDSQPAFDDVLNVELPVLGQLEETDSLKSWIKSHASVLSFFVEHVFLSDLPRSDKMYCIGRIFSPLQHVADYRAAKYPGTVQYTPLHWAAEEGYLHIVKFLVDEEGADVDLKDWRNKNALSLAWDNNRNDVVAFLQGNERTKIEYYNENVNSSITVSPTEEKYPLHVAASNGKKRTIRAFLSKEGYSVNDLDNLGATPLFKAVEHDQKEMVKYLLTRYNADASIVDGVNRETVLHKASATGNLPIVQLLAKSNVDFSAQDDTGLTALHRASERGHIEVVKFLCKHGAINEDAVDLMGYSPAFIAAQKGHLPVVKYLMERKMVQLSQPTVGNTTNNNSIDEFWAPLFVAARKDHLDIVKFMVETVHAPVDMYDSDGNTPLHLASAFGCMGIVNYLLDKQASAVALNFLGNSPLDKAAQGNHVQVVNRLIQVAGSNEAYMSALSWASRAGSLESVISIVSNTSVHAAEKDIHGFTPLNLAASNGHIEVVRVLLEENHTTKELTKAKLAARKNFHYDVAEVIAKKIHVPQHLVANPGTVHFDFDARLCNVIIHICAAIMVVLMVRFSMRESLKVESSPAVPRIDSQCDVSTMDPSALISPKKYNKGL